ncbi:PREDICTED: mesotocin receptor-like [Branchiostoma belcheri]|uniref:Mesotocin receptor-like n=1 Tax=Branchiostoma belcheri TaxID=7741 RepID=A0A6P4XBQ4_BRABE|nr:PREDICTED: mesotocin receptor-like [Branchiostoma belcheri]
MEGSGDNSFSLPNVSNQSFPTAIPGFQRDETLAAIEVGVLGAMMFLALGGNLCVLADIYHSRRHHRRMHLFLTHLCIADLAVAFTNILPQLIWDVTGRFLAGDIMCRVVKFIQLASLYGSSYVLVATAMDRYSAICHPMSVLTKTSKHPKRLILLSWCLSFLFAVPQAQIFRLQLVQGEYDCWGEFEGDWGDKAYVTWCCLSLFVVPCFIIAFVYVLICRQVWKSFQSDNLDVVRTRRGVKVTRHRQLTVRPRTHMGIDFTATKVKTVQMTLVIVIAYVVCWSPFFVCHLWNTWDTEAPFEGAAFTIIMLLASLNSCVNPWIYFLFTGQCFGSLRGRKQQYMIPTTFRSRSSPNNKHLDRALHSMSDHSGANGHTVRYVNGVNNHVTFVACYTRSVTTKTSTRSMRRGDQRQPPPPPPPPIRTVKFSLHDDVVEYSSGAPRSDGVLEVKKKHTKRHTHSFGTVYSFDTHSV